MFLKSLVSSVVLFTQICFCLNIKRNLNGSNDVIWDYEDDEKKIQGVSLGGWFVLEPFISPSLFEQFGDDESEIPVDEYTFTEKLGKEEAERQLQKHWSTWITESDLKDIKNYGLNMVRIPIGYWAFNLLEDDPYVQGQEPYLDKALEWCKKNDLKVWIDLHGVPGSQNGFDNSGKRGNVTWQDDEENIELSYETLDYIFGKYGGENYTDTIIGIEIINEPFHSKLNETEMLQFYYNTYYDYRIKHGSRNFFLFQEAFEPIGFWNKHLNNDFLNVSKPFMKDIIFENEDEDDNDDEIPKNYFHDTILDHHHYEVFTIDQLEKSENARIQDIKNYGKDIFKNQKYHPSIVGEWSGAITDCTKWLNGVGTGARYDGTFNDSQLIRSNAINGTMKSQWKFKDDEKSCENVTFIQDFSDQHKENIRKFIEIQLITWENSNSGWIFWNYKTENAIEWDFKKLVENKLFPHPFDDYKFFYKNGTQIVESSASSISSSSSFNLLFISLISIIIFALS